MKLLILLILIHLIADFILQNDKLSKNKYDFYRDKRKKISIKNPLIVHGIVVFVSMQILYFFFSPGYRILILTFLISLVHIVIDHIKLTHIHNKGKRGMIYFLLDQFLHLTSIFLLRGLFPISYQNKYLYLFGSYRSSTNNSQIKLPELLEKNMLCVITFIVFSIIAGYLIAFILEEFQEIKVDNNKEKIEKKNQPNDQVKKESSISEKEKKIGIRIGIIERMLVIIFVAIGQYGAMGLILAGKSLARFEDLKDKNFAEYYLLGTLLSFLFGIIGGSIIQLLK